jgi:transglutaminase-like putative cysteine protease
MKRRYHTRHKKINVIILTIVTTIFALALPTAGANIRTGTVTLEIDLSAQRVGKSVRLWVPYPVSDKHQFIGDIAVEGDYEASGVYTDREHGTPIFYASWSENSASKTLLMSFSVERREIVKGDFPPSEPPWNREDYARYLMATSLGPVEGPVKKLADDIARDKTTVLAKAKAIYDWTVENMFRDPNTVGCGKGDVCALLQRPGGKCTDISSVFVALCRAAGVPAREVFSVRLGKDSKVDITTHQHCWAEFFLPGYGWVSVDPADVRKAMLVEKLELADKKTKEYQDYFWGNIDPYRVVIARGRDVILNPPQDGPPLNTFGYPYAEVAGKPLDFYQPQSFVYRYTFKSK